MKDRWYILSVRAVLTAASSQETGSIILGNGSQQTGQSGRKWLVLGTVILMAILAGWGWRNQQNARDVFLTATAMMDAVNLQETAQANAESRAAEAERQAQTSLAYQLAAQGSELFSSEDSKQMTAMLLAIQSTRLHPNSVASGILYNDELAYPVFQVNHGSGVNFIAFSPDGKYLVSAGEHDNTIRASEVETGREIARVVHDFGVWSADISADSRFVVSGGGDSIARVWEIDSGKQIATMAHGGVVWTVAFSPDGKYVISSSNDEITRLWESQTGREIARLTREGRAPSVVFSPDGSYLIDDATTVVWMNPGEEFPRITHPVQFSAVSSDGRYTASHTCDRYEPSTACGESSIYVWEVETGRKISQMVQAGGITWLEFSPAGDYLVAASYDNGAQLWETFTGREVFRKIHGWYVPSARFTSDGRYVVSGGGSTVSVWQVPLGRELARIVHEWGINVLDVSPDGRYIASGGGFVARVWKIDDRRQVAQRTHTKEVSCMASSPDGRYIASGAEDGIARVWEAETGRQVSRIRHDAGVISIAFSPEGNYVASGSRDGAVHIWDARTSEEVALLRHESDVTSVGFSHDSRYALTVSGDSVHVWDVRTGNQISHMTHADGASAAAFSPDGRLVISGGCDLIIEGGACFAGSARVWEAETGRELSRIRHAYLVQAVGFSPDGTYVLSGGDQIARVWEASTGQEVAQMTHESGANIALFSPDGKSVVSAGGDIVYLWDAQTGREIHALGHQDFVYSAAFSSNGKYLITLEINQNTIHVWDVMAGEEILNLNPDYGVFSVMFTADDHYLVLRGRDQAVHVMKYRPEDLIADACMRVTRNLTREEWDQFIGEALPPQAICPNLPIEPELNPYYIILPTPVSTETTGTP